MNTLQVAVLFASLGILAGWLITDFMHDRHLTSARRRIMNLHEVVAQQSIELAWYHEREMDNAVLNVAVLGAVEIPYLNKQ